MNQTNVIIVSAPSGSGKSTLIRLLLEKAGGLVFSISYTTRQPRGQEANGREYFFVAPEEFDRMRGTGEFLESATVFGAHSYGTARRFLDQARAEGKDLLLDIDVQGAAQVRERVPEAISVFVLPPSRAELEQRLRSRAQDATEAIDRRLRRAADEIGGHRDYDYVLVNQNVADAAERLCALVLWERWRQRDAAERPEEFARWLELAAACRRAAMQLELKPILESFALQS